MNSKNIIVISILIIALSIAYYFVIFLPQRERHLDNLRAENAANLQLCLTNANQYELQAWKNACEKLGFDSNCLLPEQWSKVVADGYSQSVENCHKSYPQQF